MTGEGHEEEFELGLPIEEVSDSGLSSLDSENVQYVGSLKEASRHAEDAIPEAEERRNEHYHVGVIADTCLEIQRATEDFVMPELKGIQIKLEYLQQEFEDKLKHDAYKDNVINHLHQELREYKGDIAKRHLKPVVMDVIKVVDDIRKLTGHYHSREPSKNDRAKLLGHLKSISSDLEDVFTWQGLASFVCNDDTFDPTRQKMLKKITTNEQARDKKVASRLRPGYEWEGRVLRPEMVAVYVYNESPADFERRESDE